ncbi:substrate-binding periplasmic protein [Bdellovibrio sp. HCB209]|uniref:substrate-binding periplasmic protein n=1 Tax=Bdellovibrio sp. HCB209 TaxID=3394354 RepID=UPI0039B6CE97
MEPSCKVWRWVAVVPLFLIALAANASPSKKIQIYTFENPPLIVKSTEGFQGLAGVYGKVVADAIASSGKADAFEVIWLPYKRALLWLDKNPQGLFFAFDRTIEREKKFNWVMSFSEVECWLYAVNPKIEIKSLADLKKYRVGVQGGSAREAEVRRHMGWSRRVEALADDNANLLKLHANRIDVWATRPMIVSEAQKALALNDKSLRPIKPLMLLFKQHLWMVGNRNMPLDSQETVRAVFGWEGKRPMKSPALSARDLLKIPDIN